MDLSKVHPKVQQMAKLLEEKCKLAGINIIITQAFRTIEYQNDLWYQGRTKPGKVVTNCKGGFSPHNYGWAIDFAPLDSADIDHDGNFKEIIWDGTIDKNWDKIGKIAESIGFEWGKRWKGFPDIPHLEIPGASRQAYLLGSNLTDSITALKKLNLIEKEQIPSPFDIPKYSDIERRGIKLFGYKKQ